MSLRARFLAALVGLSSLIAGCTGTPASIRSPSPTPSPAPTPTPTPPRARAVFDATRALAHNRILAVTIGPREAGSASYVRASRYVTSVLDGYGYSVGIQRVPLPSGTSQGVTVASGRTRNVVATPPGFDPSVPHLVVGAHLDTVAPSPGGNDNGSGMAVFLELARLASIARTTMPIVWVAFGGEERRRPGFTGATFGSRYYLERLSPPERRAIRGMLAIDMVGNGRVAYVCHESLTEDTFVDALIASARRLRLPARKRVVMGLFSDHGPFEHAGFVVGWLWSGEHATLHTPRDTFSVVQRSSVDRVGRIAWETLRTLRL